MENKTQMVAEVNKIIANRLITNQSIHLPSVGSLIVVSKAAKMNNSGKTIAPPTRVVDFSSEVHGESLVVLIQQCAECTPEQAAHIYESYLSEARTQDGLVVAGVAVLKGKSVVVDADFAAKLNTATVAVLPQKRSKCKYVVLLLIFILLAVVAYLFWGKIFCSSCSESAPVQTEVQVVEPEVVEPEVAVEQVVAPVQKRYRVVYGVYEVTENVERAKAEARQKFGNDIVINTYPFGETTMVTIFESDSQQEAQDFLNRGRDLVYDLWMHERR